MNAKELITLLESLELDEIDTELFQEISDYQGTQTNGALAHKLQTVRKIISLIQKLNED